MEHIQSIYQGKNVLAPLVGGSDLSYRLLCRSYGATLTFTEMCIASYYGAGICPKEYTFEFDESDRPLVLQLAGRSAEPIIRLANDPMFIGNIDAVDLNCGCPQNFAMEKGYGAGLLYFQDELVEMCREIVPAIPYPLSIKMRLHESIEETISIIGRLRDVGVNVFTVHGRYHWQKKDKRGVADWDAIKIIKETYPELIIIGNGDISSYDDFVSFKELYDVDSAMAGYGALLNPSIFSSTEISIGQRISDYIEISRNHYNRYIALLRHINWMLKSLKLSKDQSAQFFRCKSLLDISNFLQEELSIPVTFNPEILDTDRIHYPTPKKQKK